MIPDPHTPVIVGVGQFLNRVDRGADPMEPVRLMLEALHLAESDATVPLAGSAEVVAAVPVISWRYYDAARLVADALGCTSAHTWYPSNGGNTPQMMLNRLAVGIAAGELDTAVLCGAEAWSTRTRAKRSGAFLHWTKQSGDAVPDWGHEDTFVMGHPAEHARGIVLPIQTYPLFETALMHAELQDDPAMDVDDHIARLGEMWAGFSRVAASNPHAWRREALSGEQITTPTAANRFVGWPYTKNMVSYPDVDMSSALIICSAERATAAGVPRDRWVFPWSGSDGIDLVMSRRRSFTGSPAMGVAATAVLEMADVGLDDVAHLDVYSCFPSAVQLFCREMGLDPLERPLTVYGGLTFGGGPWNNPVGHALGSMVEVLRSEPGTLGLVTANGGNVDRHAFGLLGSDPPPLGYRYSRPQNEIDCTAPRGILETYDGPATIESWTVMYNRESEAERLHGSCLTPAGERVWTLSEEPALMAYAVREDLGERACVVDTGGRLRLSD